jgi:hypothetical protein
MKIKKELIMREIAGDVILVPVGETVLEHNGLFMLNEISGRIWQLLQEGKSFEEIAETLEGEYDAPSQVIRQDLEEFLNALVAHGILER